MPTATREQFVDAANDIWKNHGVYLWGGNGEATALLSFGKIASIETSRHDAYRVMKHISELYDAGYDMSKSIAADCSGLIVKILRDLKCIPSTADYRARDLQNMCRKKSLDKLQPGDLVFNKEKTATHTGIYVGNLMVIEMQGRDRGCVKRKISEGAWVCGGSLPYIK